MPKNYSNLIGISIKININIIDKTNNPQ